MTDWELRPLEAREPRRAMPGSSLEILTTARVADLLALAQPPGSIRPRRRALETERWRYRAGVRVVRAGEWLRGDALGRAPELAPRHGRGRELA